MRAVFADTFYFIALLDSRDPAHAKAVYFSRRPGWRFVTTEYVLVELADAFHKPPMREEFLTLWELLQREPVFRIVPAQKSLLHRGIQRYKKRADKEWQLTDCLSFVVMDDEGITEALTGDRHFEQAGFRALLA
jgi:hypothetical protein